jgi:hypothetical protein
MFRLAREAGIPLMSSSALRYADNLTAMLSGNAEKVIGVDVFGPMNILPEPPGLFWYGIHSVETAFTVLGPGWKEVRAVANENTDIVTATWADGRVATIRGVRNGHGSFGITIHREKSFQQADLYKSPRPLYAGMLEAVLKNLPAGKSAIPEQETLEIVELLEAANEARQTGGVVKRE